jgi:hypothetical protein
VKLLVAAAVALLLAAAAAAKPPKKVILPAVQAQAKAVNVQRSDLPGTGWKAEPSNSKGSTPRCSYYNPDQSDLTENGDADSPDFTLASESNSFVSSTVGIFVSSAQAQSAYSRIVQPALPKCLAELFKQGLTNPSQVTIVSSAAIPFPNVAERTNAYRIVANYKASASQSVPVRIDVVVLNRGKVDVALFFFGVAFRFNASFERQLAATVAARAAAVH